MSVMVHMFGRTEGQTLCGVPLTRDVDAIHEHCGSTDWYKFADNKDHCDTCRNVALYEDPRLPVWAKQHGAVFALDGVNYRIIATPCSTNRDTWQNRSFREYVHVERLDEKRPWNGLPEAPASKHDVYVALKKLFSTREVYAPDLLRAIHVVEAT